MRREGEITLQPGWDLVMAGWAGQAGAAAAAAGCREELRNHFPGWLLESEPSPAPGDVMRSARLFGPAAVYCLAKGGILSGLWEMAEEGGVGLEIDLRRIPIRQETVEICEYLDMNPYYLDTTGAVLIGAPQGEALVSCLEEERIPAAVIGWTTGGKDRIIHSRGIRRYLGRPQEDEWERAAARRSR